MTTEPLADILYFGTSKDKMNETMQWLESLGMTVRKKYDIVRRHRLEVLVTIGREDWHERLRENGLRNFSLDFQLRKLK